MKTDPRAPAVLQGVWKYGILAALSWGATAIVTVALPDVVPWGSADLFATLTGIGTGLLLLLSLVVNRLGSMLVHYRPWFFAVGIWLLLWALGFGSGIIVDSALGVGLGWSAHVNYWSMPILKLIAPVPATAWIPVTFYFFPTTFNASIFIVALSAGIPVEIDRPDPSWILVFQDPTLFP